MCPYRTTDLALRKKQETWQLW